MRPSRLGKTPKKRKLLNPKVQVDEYGWKHLITVVLELREIQEVERNWKSREILRKRTIENLKVRRNWNSWEKVNICAENHDRSVTIKAQSRRLQLLKWKITVCKGYWVRELYERRCRGWPDVSDYRVPVCRMPMGYRVPGLLRMSRAQKLAGFDVGRIYGIKPARSNKWDKMNFWDCEKQSNWREKLSIVLA
jgi:hypothetical protein